MSNVSEFKEVDLSIVRVRGSRHPIIAKLLNLEVGQGFEVKGEERGKIAHLVSVEGKKTKRSFGTKRLGPEHYLVYRYA